MYFGIFCSELKKTIKKKDKIDSEVIIIKNIGQIYLKYLLAYSSLNILLIDGAMNND
tara:strand:+ start:1351 stop:1521 length:171 start_codon:yes stop_codon:yes gene_type:complete